MKGMGWGPFLNFLWLLSFFQEKESDNNECKKAKKLDKGLEQWLNLTTLIHISMEIIKVGKSDLAIINDILVNHIDISNRSEVPPTVEHLHTLLEDNRNYLLAAIHYNSVIGYALAYRFPSLYSSDYLAYLYDIEVSEIHRRKGVGRLLIEKILEYLKLDNVKELWLGTGIDNPEGQGLFSATGAIKSEETFNDYTYYLG